MELYKKIIISGTMELISGMHIGDSKESVEIGGVDSPVVRRKDNNQPYIPGSSLKGKIRSLLEYATGTNAKNSFKEDAYTGTEEGKLIPKLFGSNGGNPSRIIVRDSYLTDEWVKKLGETLSSYTDMPYTEIKFENVINRIKGTAEHPRQIERIPAGAVFNIEFVINLLKESEEDITKKEEDFIGLLQKGIKLLEDDYLGGNGTRGYGQVKFSLKEPNRIEISKLLA